MEYKDYYKTLGVGKTADEKELKKAYRKLARQYHPDVNPDDASAESRFKEVNEAYEVLSDPEKRKMYDQFGSQWQQYQRAGGNVNDFWQQWQAQQGGPRAQTRNFSQEDLSQMFGSSGGFSDFFESLFGGMGRQTGGFDFGSGQRGQPRARRGRDVEHTVEVTLEEAFQGTTRQLQWEDGRTLSAKIPRGVKTGSRIRLSGQGGSGAGGSQSGDLYLKVEVLPHETFERDEDDLRAKVPVDLYTAVLGGSVQVASLDRTVTLTIPEGTANGKTFRLRGLGMPKLKNSDERGDLYATLEVRLPERLSDKEKELFHQLRDLHQQK